MSNAMDEVEPTPVAWKVGSFVDILKGTTHTLPFYSGDGEEDPLDDLGLMDILQNQDVVEGKICPVVDLSWESYKQSWQPWHRALVLGKSFTFNMLEPRIRRAWQLELGCELIDIGKGFIVPCFYSRADYMKVLNGGLWTILGHYLTITKWRPNFKLAENEIHTTLVWIRFLTLPLEMFDDKSLLGIANVVGKGVKVDTHSVDKVKGKYARVYMELDLNATLVPNVLVWGKKQPVEYEGLPHICFNYGKHGHKQELCRVNREATSEGQERPDTRIRKQTTSTAAQPFGSWMLFAHVRRRQEQMKARVSRRSMPSEANRWLNAQIEKDLWGPKDHRPQHPTDPNTDGSDTFLFGSDHSNRGKQPMSANLGEPRGSVCTDGGGDRLRSKFAILADVRCGGR